MTISHRTVDVNGVRVHLAEAGAGPVVLLLHGFLNYSYSWRHQLEHLAAAGFRAVAPDMRGYGDTDRPVDIEAYTSLHLVGDVIAILDALDSPEAVIAGHDWGAMIAWQTALLRPDRVRGVVGLTVPYVPRGDASLLDAMVARFGENYYMNYFQEPGPADSELATDVAETFRRVLFSGGGEAQALWDPRVQSGQGWLQSFPDPGRIPAWMTQEAFDAYTRTFERSAFSGALNWYRCIDLSWKLMAPWAGAKVHRPALFIYGTHDSFVNYAKHLIDDLPNVVPDLRGIIALPGCGHWVQQERPDEVSKALVDFVTELAAT
jgi:pimeloyl-ACP methyl ester carboxylesterase